MTLLQSHRTGTKMGANATLVTELMWHQVPSALWYQVSLPYGGPIGCQISIVCALTTEVNLGHISSCSVYRQCAWVGGPGPCLCATSLVGHFPSDRAMQCTSIPSRRVIVREVLCWCFVRVHPGAWIWVCIIRIRMPTTTMLVL